MTIRQRGAVALSFAVALVALLGAVGIVLDLGQLFVNKAEIQNAMDACALAASKELTGVSASQLELAENAGIVTANRNRAGFQSAGVTMAGTDVAFSDRLNGTYRPRPAIAAGEAAAMKFARCSWTRAGIPMYVMQVLGIGPQNVAAAAVATLQPSVSSCAVPLALCARPTGAVTCPPGAGSPTFGLCRGDWVSGGFGAGGGVTGSFNWIDYSPPSGGESELAALLLGQGRCDRRVADHVGQTGVLGAAAAKAWNSRFGLYLNGAGNPQPDMAPPDYTGYSYTNANWPAPDPAYPNNRNAYAGTSATGAPNFKAARAAFHSFGRTTDTLQSGEQITGLNFTGNAYSVTTHGSGGGHGTYGADRRLVTGPIVDCSAWASSQTVPILGWACILLLQPSTGATAQISMEYRGPSSEPGSPCAVAGLPAGPNGFGPLVPALVQ